MPPQLVTQSPSARPPGLGLPGLPRAEGGGMTRLPPQPDDNLDQAAASILESEVPARSTVRAVNEPGRPLPASRHRWFTCRAAPRRIARWRGSPRRRAAVPLDPNMATFGNLAHPTAHPTPARDRRHEGRRVPRTA